MRHSRLLPMVLCGVALLVGPGSVRAEDERNIPFTLPIPDGWRTETIPFPLGFAPELDYTGLEELRFAPGMFRDGAEDYWTYAFVWWIPLTVDPTAERLQTDLEAYFHVAIESYPCQESGHRALLFLLSPQDEEHSVWRSLEKIRDGFRCD